jgi:hypothetical protein
MSPHIPIPIALSLHRIFHFWFKRADSTVGIEASHVDCVYRHHPIVDRLSECPAWTYFTSVNPRDHFLASRTDSLPNICQSTLCLKRWFPPIRSLKSIPEKSLSFRNYFERPLLGVPNRFSPNFSINFVFETLVFDDHVGLDQGPILLLHANTFNGISLL